MATRSGVSAAWTAMAIPRSMSSARFVMVAARILNGWRARACWSAMDEELAVALAAVGREVRDAVLSVPVTSGDGDVVRVAGGDAVFGVDARADVVLVDALRRHCGERWPGRLIMEGSASEAPIGTSDGAWVSLADPVDGTRPWLAGKR